MSPGSPQLPLLKVSRITQLLKRVIVAIIINSCVEKKSILLLRPRLMNKGLKSLDYPENERFHSMSTVQMATETWNLQHIHKNIYKKKNYSIYNLKRKFPHLFNNLNMYQQHYSIVTWSSSCFKHILVFYHVSNM